MKRLSLLVLPLLALVFLGAGCFTTTVNIPVNANQNANTNQPAVASIDVPLAITKSTDDKKEYTVSVEQDSTALALLQKTATEQNFTVDMKTYDFGDLVEGIDGLKADNAHLWSFSVNGSPATVGAGEYQLQPGDQIEFRYEAL